MRRKVEPGQRYGAMVEEVQEHLNKVTGLQADLHKKLEELEKEEGRKITSEGIHTGFDSSHVNKSTASASSLGMPTRAPPPWSSSIPTMPKLAPIRQPAKAPTAMTGRWTPRLPRATSPR